MCGITGLVGFKGRITVDRIRDMARSIRHRGPDDEGYFLANSYTGEHAIAGGPDTPRSVLASQLLYAPKQLISDFVSLQDINLILANRRLAILDLSPAGHQPMCNEDGTLWITHNGEVYNFQELRKELEQFGHQFTSQTDTEVILHAYEQWGPDCLHRFNGMWAFAIWDSRRRVLFCSRDRFGIKPFYYYWDGRTFVFASEIKAILASGLIEPKPNDPIIYDYLAYGLVDHTDETFFKGIKPLPGGHYLELRFDQRALNIHRWYDIPLENKLLGLSDEEYARRFYDLFEDAVRLRLVSDVPVGTCLSGGLDSSSIVCVVDRLMREQGVRFPSSDLQRTFSARYVDSCHDEGPFIQAVVRQTGVDARFTFPTAESLEQELQSLIWHQDEPFGTTSTYAQWNVFRLAKECGVTVTLDGQGGDEILAGYHHFYGPLFAQLAKSRRFGTLGREIYYYHRNHKYPWIYALYTLAVNLLPTGTRTRLKQRLRYPSWINRVRGNQHHSFWNTNIPAQNVFDGHLYWNLFVGIRKILRFEDRSSMAHSVESRLPFLDYRLVEFAFTLPYDQKIRLGTTKWILREAMRQVLPPIIRNRQDKIGFSTPEDQWFRKGFRHVVLEIIDSPSFRGRPYFRMHRLKDVLEEHLRGVRNLSTDIWRWINLEIWLRQFIDGEPWL